MSKSRFAPRRLIQFRLRSLLLLMAVVGAAVALYAKRLSEPPAACATASHGGHVWISPPSVDEVLNAIRKANPSFTEPPGRLFILTEKTADHLEEPGISLLAGAVQRHRVRFKCSAFDGSRTAPFAVVYIDYDHYHGTGRPTVIVRWN